MQNRCRRNGRFRKPHVGAPECGGFTRRRRRSTDAQASGRELSSFHIGEGLKVSLPDCFVIKKKRRYNWEMRWTALPSAIKLIATKNKPTSGTSDSAKREDVQDTRGALLTKMFWLNPILKQHKNPECETLQDNGLNLSKMSMS